MTLLLSRKDVESLLTMDACLGAVEAAFGALARGQVDMPQRAVIRVPEPHGVFLSMPARIGGGALGIKVVTVFPENPAKKKLPTTLATLLLCDPTSGKAIAIMDAGYLTAMRTGAASGVATKYLAREDASICTLFGAGVQARTQLMAMKAVRPIAQAFVVDVLDEAAEKFAREMGAALGIEMAATRDVRAAVEAADLIVTASSSQEPVFSGAWLRPGTHINNVGSHSPGARELDTATVKASKFVADLKAANLAEAGDILIPIQEGALTEAHIHASLGEIVIGARPGRENREEITVFKSCGLAVQDIATAVAVYGLAPEKGVGTEVEL